MRKKHELRLPSSCCLFFIRSKSDGLSTSTTHRGTFVGVVTAKEVVRVDTDTKTLLLAPFCGARTPSMTDVGVAGTGVVGTRGTGVTGREWSPVLDSTGLPVPSPHSKHVDVNTEQPGVDTDKDMDMCAEKISETARPSRVRST